MAPCGWYAIGTSMSAHMSMGGVVATSRPPVGGKTLSMLGRGGQTVRCTVPLTSVWVGLSSRVGGESG